MRLLIVGWAASRAGLAKERGMAGARHRAAIGTQG
jgi:hypothetical protein